MSQDLSKNCGVCTLTAGHCTRVTCHGLVGAGQHGGNLTYLSFCCCPLCSLEESCVERLVRKTSWGGLYEPSCWLEYFFVQVIVSWSVCVFFIFFFTYRIASLLIALHWLSLFRESVCLNCYIQFSTKLGPYKQSISLWSRWKYLSTYISHTHIHGSHTMYPNDLRYPLAFLQATMKLTFLPLSEKSPQWFNGFPCDFTQTPMFLTGWTGTTLIIHKLFI